jgi:hypothetical protein
MKVEGLYNIFLREFFDTNGIPKESVLNDVVTYFGEFEVGLIESIKCRIESCLDIATTESQRIILSSQRSRSEVNKYTRGLKNLLRVIDSIQEQFFGVNFDQSIVCKARINLDEIESLTTESFFSKAVRKVRQIIY